MERQNGTPGNTVEEMATSNMRENGIPRKKDGTPDMRFKVNKTASGSSSSSCTGRSSSGESIGPLKSDGTPDMRYAVNKAAYSSPSSSNTSGYRAYGSGTPASGSSRRGSISPGPLKSDGTPDMRYAAKKATYSSPSSSNTSGYRACSSGTPASGSSRRGSISPGPLKSDGTRDMRYAVKEATYSCPSSSNTSGYRDYSSGTPASGSSRRGSSSPRPLKSDGTPDMRYSVNKATYSSQMSRRSSGYSSGSSYYSSAGYSTSSETQGQLVGAGKRLNGRGKKLGEEKSRKKVGAPGILLLTDQFRNHLKSLPVIGHKNIFVPNHRQGF